MGKGKGALAPTVKGPWLTSRAMPLLVAETLLRPAAVIRGCTRESTVVTRSPSGTQGRVGIRIDTPFPCDGGQALLHCPPRLTSRRLHNPINTPYSYIFTKTPRS